MGLPLLKEAFEAVQAASNPLEPDMSASSGEMLDVLVSIVARSKRKVTNWKDQVAKLMRDIPLATEDYISSGGNLKDIISDLEDLKLQVELRQSKLVFLIDQAKSLSGQDNRPGYDLLFGSADLFLDHAKRMNALMDEDLEVGSELLNFLTITIAEIDPETRGGPSFEDADALISFLHKEVDA